MFVFLGQSITGVLVEWTASADGTPTLLGYQLVFAVVALMVAGALAGYLFSDDAPP